jgi:hypothetical protein
VNDRPTAAELAEAVRLFLEQELAPALEDARLRFGTLIAANVLGIVSRELATETDHLREEWTALAGLLGEMGPTPTDPAELRRAVRGLNERLCQRIRDGALDDPEGFRAAAAVVRRQVVRKLEVANPRYVAARRP